MYFHKNHAPMNFPWESLVICKKNSYCLSFIPLVIVKTPISEDEEPARLHFGLKFGQFLFKFSNNVNQDYSSKNSIF